MITEFRRAVLIVREQPSSARYSFNENNLASALVPYRGLVTFTAQLRLHPLHNYARPPGYEMYVRTGPSDETDRARRTSSASRCIRRGRSTRRRR